MVYINETSGTITIPKHTQSSGKYTLVLTSNLSNDITLVANGNNISTNALYYKFALEGVNLNVGEYTYTLYNASNKVLEIGLVTYGEFSKEIIINTPIVKEKIQYNPNSTEPANAIKANTYYYGFGINVNDMLEGANTQSASNMQEHYFTATSTKEDSKYYVIYDANIIYTEPIEFTCGGAPMVMTKTRVTINNKSCIVWESGEIYPNNTELSVISINI